MNLNNLFPPETSLIPVTVSLTRFIQENGFASMFGWYPYWYLGTPYRYLTGPITPLLIVALQKTFQNVTLFDITIWLIILSFLAGAIGWGVLFRRIQNPKSPPALRLQRAGKFQIILLVILLLLFPWRFFSSLAISEASFTLARNFLPWALLGFWRVLKRNKTNKTNKTNLGRGLVAIFFTSLSLLINTSILPILIVGLVSLTLAASFKGGKFTGIIKRLKRGFLLIAFCLLLATFWYTPSYWWTILTNPSIGGASGFKVILRILEVLKSGIPLVLAVFSVFIWGKVKNRLAVFSLIWFLTFAFLSIFRFMGDPDFWMDWTSWFYELETGVALLIAQKFQTSKIPNIQIGEKLKDKNNWSFGVLALGVFLFTTPFYSVWRVHKAIGMPPLITREIPEGVKSLKKLAEITRGERVFLSGSTVFWANALFDINQVRGGVDKAAIHPFWHHAAYQLREGTSPLAVGWLEVLGTRFVLVHGPKSPEFYHDFKNIQKWEDVGGLLYNQSGDLIFDTRTESAWVVDLEKLELVSKPKDGKDIATLNKYLSARKRAAKVNWKNPNEIVLEAKVDRGEGIALPVAYDRGWQGEDVLIRKDPFGNILIIPNETLKALDLKYRTFF